MAPKPQKLGFIFAAVLVMAVFVAITTWGAGPKTHNGSAALSPAKGTIWNCPGPGLIREGGVGHPRPVGSGGVSRKGEERHDDSYHAFIASARAQPRDGLARCGHLL